METPITRVALFKVSSKEHQALLVKEYKEIVTKTQSKDGKPYILSMECGIADENSNAASQGFTFVVKSVFKNKADMDFYESGCDAHQKYRNYIKDSGILVEGSLTVYYTAEVSVSV